MSNVSLDNHRIVPREEWLVAAKALLIKEKELTRRRDRLAEERRALPWVKVDKEYVFETTSGKKPLAGLFDSRSQLVVYHFMWRRELGNGCIGCSFIADHIDGANLHLAHRDVSLVICSRAPLADIQAFRERMGWKFKWVSSYGNDFNFDYGVSFTPDDLARGHVYYNYGTVAASIEELPGISVFYRDGHGDIFHTYSSYARGNEEILGAYMWLDLTPKGRNETGPTFSMGDWVRHHDRYDADGFVDSTGGYHEPECPI
ncbi:MAG: thioredoxin family protein [Candidatus Cybelea sp.]